MTNLRALLKASIAVLTLSGFCTLAANAADPVVITIHAKESQGEYRPIWNYFGADEPNSVYAPNGEKLLNELTALSPKPVYFRAHNLMTTGDGRGSLKWGSTNVYTERPDGTPLYDWTITDRIFDSFKRNHIRPLVEVGFMPEALSTHPEPYRHEFPKGEFFTGWSYPPRDYDKWKALISAWVHHLHERYGDSVNDWLWEVWNEPDIKYWRGTPEEFFRLYDITADAIRRELPSAKVGGPDSTGPGSEHSIVFLKQFLDHCAHGRNAATGDTGAPLAFISFHPKGSVRFVDDHVRMSIAGQLKAIERGMKIVVESPEWHSTPIIMGECDPEGCAACQGAQEGYRDGPLYGLSVAEATARTYELARKYGVNLQGSVTWAFEFEDQPYFAGFRELATNGIDKPVLNVFRMLGMLGGNWVKVESTGAAPLDRILNEGVVGAPDVNAIATRSKNEVSILVWNYHDDDIAADPAQVQINVADLPRHKIHIEQFLMDSSHSNAYSVWEKLGRPQPPTAAEQAQIEKAGALESVEQKLSRSKDGGAVINLSLQRQGVALLRLRW